MNTYIFIAILVISILAGTLFFLRGKAKKQALEQVQTTLTKYIKNAQLSYDEINITGFLNQNLSHVNNAQSILT